jgi:diguanylate cyclase
VKVPADSTMPTLRQVLARAHIRLIVFAVLMAGITLTASGVLVIRGYAVRNLALIAQSVAYTVEPALVFGDIDAAQKGIAAVAAPENVDVRDPQGHMLVASQRAPGGPMTMIERGVARLAAPSTAMAEVRHGDRLIARVYVHDSAERLGRFILVGLATAIGCVALTLGATWKLAQRLQRDVADPLARIAEVAHAVRVKRQFARRAPPSHIREVDQLTRDFNALLEELRDWHNGILSHNRILEQQATRDALTGLGNRAMFDRALPAAIAQADALGQPFAVLYVDVNRFKPINDTHGHDAGDTVLIVIAARLRASLRNGDGAFRLGGDEFALILAPGIDPEDLDAVKARIAASMAQPIMLPDGQCIDGSLSIGSARYPQDSADARDLLRHADAAMYAAKARRETIKG